MSLGQQKQIPTISYPEYHLFQPLMYGYYRHKIPLQKRLFHTTSLGQKKQTKQKNFRSNSLGLLLHFLKQNTAKQYIIVRIVMMNQYMTTME